MPGRKLPAVDETPTFFRVRMRQPRRFVTHRVPAWAMTVSESISKGSKVTMGQRKDGTWAVQSVMIRKGAGKTKRTAKSLAIRIRNKIERR